MLPSNIIYFGNFLFVYFSLTSVACDILEVSETKMKISAEKGGGGLTTGGLKFAKTGAVGDKMAGAGLASAGAKKFALKGGLAGLKAGLGTVKKGGAIESGEAMAKFGKVGFKKGKLRKVYGIGHDRSFTKIIIHGHDRKFIFGSMGGEAVAAEKMGGMKAGKKFAAKNGLAAAKAGKKAFKKGFVAAGDAKGAIKKGAFNKGAFKKGAIIGAKNGMKTVKAFESKKF